MDDHNHLRAHSHFMNNWEICAFFGMVTATWREKPYGFLYMRLANVRGGSEFPIPSYKYFRDGWDEELDRAWFRFSGPLAMGEKLGP